MFDAIKKMFQGGANQDAGDDRPSPEIAAAVLMVQAALADREFSPQEREKICQILREGFKLEPARADAVLAEAEEIAETAVGHHRYTQVVKDMPLEHRKIFMTHLWMVALADGKKDDEEDSLLRRLSPLLALSDRDRTDARQDAERLAAQ
ncbi:MAG: TerB family tellurite resistance protein [Oceanicaulis sp.]